MSRRSGDIAMAGKPPCFLNSLSVTNEHPLTKRMSEYMERKLFVQQAVAFNRFAECLKKRKKWIREGINFHDFQRNPLLQLRPDPILHPDRYQPLEKFQVIQSKQVKRGRGKGVFIHKVHFYFFNYLMNSCKKSSIKYQFILICILHTLILMMYNIYRKYI